MSLPTREQITEALRSVIDPELRKDIVELGMVRSIAIAQDGEVAVTVSLTTPGCPIRSHFSNSVVAAVKQFEGVTTVSVDFDVLTDAEKGELQRRLGRGGLPAGALAQVANVVCVGSGKGGVGKSSLTANLAVALAADGKRVGILDADVWGYSIPRMFGLGGQRPPVSPERKILPLEAHGVKVMSIGFFVEEDSAVVWRGPMLHKALTQFLEDVAWGELDVLLVDLPPGTGDAQLTMAQQVPLAGAVIVSTPQDLALIDARKGLNMFRKVDVPVLGIVENMSTFICPHCGSATDIFAHGGAQSEAKRLGVPFLGEVPLELAIRETSDAGKPVVVSAPSSPAAAAYRAIAAKAWAELERDKKSARAAPRIVMES